MAIEDNNPERRNLVLLSMSIIAFYIGRADIGLKGTLELPLLKIEFTDSSRLAVLMWIVLFWFTFRYWIVNKDRIREDMYSELHMKRFGLNFFIRQLRMLFVLSPEKSVRQIFFFHYKDNEVGEDSTLTLKYLPLETSGYVQDIEKLSPDLSPEYDVLSLGETKIMFIVAALILFFRKPSLSAYYVPYLITFLAVILGIIN